MPRRSFDLGSELLRPCDIVDILLELMSLILLTSFFESLLFWCGVMLVLAWVGIEETKRSSHSSHHHPGKERFLFCVDTPCPRYAELPADVALPDGQAAWTWLPLYLHQAAAFGWEKYHDSPDRVQSSGLHAAADEDGAEFAPDSRCIGPIAGYAVNFS